MKIDHIHFFVEDAARQRDWLMQCMGWKFVSRATLTDRDLEVLRYRDTYFLLSSPRTSDSLVAEYLRTYAPGVADVAIEVEDLAAVWQQLQSSPLFMQKGMGDTHSGRLIAPTSQASPVLAQLAHLEAKPQPRSWASIAGWGSLSHTLVERRSRPRLSLQLPQVRPHRAIDHIVLNVPAGELAAAVGFYQHLLGLQQGQSFKIQTERSGLRSQVLSDPVSQFYFNINEPASANSQIQEFLDANHGAGIQHIALHSEPILTTVAAWRQQGLPLLSVPDTYYRRLQERLQGSSLGPPPLQEWQQIVEQQILIDWHPEQPESLLLQIFSLPVFSRNQFFFEFIERREAVQGFGEGNFLALYEAIEAELQHQSR
ncbi:MAG: 4-hydroxyphenylpyruvate dioxygenase family protein [Leptolyngbyaceae cyanobacterium]